MTLRVTAGLYSTHAQAWEQAPPHTHTHVHTKREGNEERKEGEEEGEVEGTGGGERNQLHALLGQKPSRTGVRLKSVHWALPRPPFVSCLFQCC